MKKRHLKRWVKNTLLFLLGVIVGITAYQIFTIRTITNNGVEKSTCYGGIVKVCTGYKAD